MNRFLDSLKYEVLYEASDEIPKKIQIVLAKLVYKEPFVAQLFGRGHTDWIPDSSIDTAGVRPHQGRIQFYYNPSFIEGLSGPELNFLLQHELYHIFRSHSSRAQAVGAGTERTHKLHNIAADALINGDCEKDGGFGGLAMKVIKGAWFLKGKAKGDEHGNVEEHWQKDAKDKYGGSEQSEAIYKWMLERDKQAKEKEQEQGQEGQEGQQGQGQSQGQGGEGPPQPPWEPSIGDVVFNKKTGKYGKVSNISNGKVKVDEVSEQEATAAISQFKQGFNKAVKKKKVYRNLMA